MAMYRGNHSKVQCHCCRAMWPSVAKSYDFFERRGEPGFLYDTLSLPLTETSLPGGLTALAWKQSIGIFLMNETF